MKKDIGELLTLREACEILKVHPNTLRKWDNKGILKAVRFGERGDRRYRQEDILKIIKGYEKPKRTNKS
jgi:excisionase family DNA binding protein